MVQVGNVIEDELITVTIPKQEYAALLNDSNTLETLMNALMQHARLSWNAEKISFSDDAISPVVQALYPEVYARVYAELLKEDGEENGTD